MNTHLFSDAQAKPRLFRWNGHVDRKELLEWLDKAGWRVPADLLHFWEFTGGGEIFESEIFLRPLVPADHEEGVEYATNSMQGRGMPTELVVFHEGLESTAVRYADGMYVSIEQDGRVGDQFGTFDEWYVRVLRAEYAARYGLDPL